MHATCAELVCALLLRPPVAARWQCLVSLAVAQGLLGQGQGFQGGLPTTVVSEGSRTCRSSFWGKPVRKCYLHHQMLGGTNSQSTFRDAFPFQTQLSSILWQIWAHDAGRFDHEVRQVTFYRLWFGAGDKTTLSQEIWFLGRLMLSGGPCPCHALRNATRGGARSIGHVQKNVGMCTAKQNLI